MYNTKNNTNWIFVIYFGTYLEGKLKIMEPGKCEEILFMTYEELMNSPLVTDSCKFLARNVKTHQKMVNRI